MNLRIQECLCAIPWRSDGAQAGALRFVSRKRLQGKICETQGETKLPIEIMGSSPHGGRQSRRAKVSKYEHKPSC